MAIVSQPVCPWCDDVLFGDILYHFSECLEEADYAIEAQADNVRTDLETLNLWRIRRMKLSTETRLPYRPAQMIEKVFE